MFEPSKHPRLFGLPPGADFPRELVRGLEARITDYDPIAVSKIDVFVNTHRMARRVIQVFTEGPARLLPRIRLVTDLGKDPLLSDLPPAADPLARRLELTQLTAQLIEADPTLAARNAAFDLADSLAALIDEMHGEGVRPQAIADLDVSDQSGHWQRAQRFFGVISEYLDAKATPEPDERQRAAIDRLVANWEERPPDHPVIVAGSTGSRGTTSLLMRAVANFRRVPLSCRVSISTCPPRSGPR